MLTPMPLHQIYYLVLLAQEIGSSLIQSPKDTPEIDMASRGLQAVDWLTAALRLGEQALRSGTLSANDNAVRVSALAVDVCFPVETSDDLSFKRETLKLLGRSHPEALRKSD